MAEETKQQDIRTTALKEVKKPVEKPQVKEEIKKAEDKSKEKPKPNEKKESSKEKIKEESTPKKTPEKIKKTEAIAKGSSLPISKKQSMYICKFIKNKPIDLAISDLSKVITMKKVVPFKGEIPHRKGKGIMSGRYPIKASKYFITLLKSLKGNIIINNLDPDKAKIAIASASWAARPMRSKGRLAKRTNIVLIAREPGVKQ